MKVLRARYFYLINILNDWALWLNRGHSLTYPILNFLGINKNIWKLTRKEMKEVVYFCQDLVSEPEHFLHFVITFVPRTIPC